MGQDHVVVQRVPVLDAGMFHHCIGNRVLVFAVELLATTRTDLAVCHCAIVADGVACVEVPGTRRTGTYAPPFAFAVDRASGWRSGERRMRRGRRNAAANCWG